jgi:two-component system response regulator HydG
MSPAVFTAAHGSKCVFELCTRKFVRRGRDQIQIARPAVAKPPDQIDQRTMYNRDNGENGNAVRHGNGMLNGLRKDVGSKVCLLDDDPSVLKATGRLLSSAGWEVEAFSDPISFLSYAQSESPMVVVLDILMPIMNGLEVQQRLRDLSPSTQVIVMTSKDDPSVRNRALEAGASAFFVKPIDDRAFLAGIETAATPR